MTIKMDNQITAEDEINLYDYWKILVRRRKLFIGIFLVPLIIVIVINLSVPRHYRGESEIVVPVLPASDTSSAIIAKNIVRIIGNLNDSQRVKILSSNRSVVKNVLVSLSPKSANRIAVIVEAESSDVIPQAFNHILSYIINMPEIKEEISAINAEADLKAERLLADTDLKIRNLVEIRKANLIYLSYLSDMMKQRKMPIIDINPADFVRENADLSLEITNLQREKANLEKRKARGKMDVGTLTPPSITRQPSNSEIRQKIIRTGLLSFFTSLFLVFLIEYIAKMKRARKEKRSATY